MKFNLYTKTKVKDNDLNAVFENVFFKDIDSAITFAREVAHSNYYLNPVRDILEIMVELNVDELTAGSIFMSDMAFYTNYYVEEVKGNANEIEVIKHFDNEGF